MLWLNNIDLRGIFFLAQMCNLIFILAIFKDPLRAVEFYAGRGKEQRLAIDGRRVEDYPVQRFDRWARARSRTKILRPNRRIGSSKYPQ